jgi:hypothetical protein
VSRGDKVSQKKDIETARKLKEDIWILRSIFYFEFEKDQNKELLLEGLKTIAMATDGMVKLVQKTHLTLF